LDSHYQKKKKNDVKERPPPRRAGKVQPFLRFVEALAWLPALLQQG
jgi:hypothetical protein